ncbi:circadian clock-controlled protein [Copidosoma floridanum]|uniref:circadian clock-controlled protein n=1 Tax=Copidosoma floridanum TaxID=29053 RepID=UPI0006C958DE|nr:circadian clock-controlled protein [Copidosoma floridanum]
MAHSTTIFALVLCASIIGCTLAVDVPDFIHVCKRNDPHIEDCIRRSVDELKPKLVTGEPTYNIPSLEPLLLKELIATEGSGGLKITAREIKAYGASNFYIQKLRVDMNTLRFAMDILLPHLYIEGLYEINGKVLLLPIRGSGPLTGNFTDATGSVKIQAATSKDINGDDHITLNEFRMRISIRKGSLNLENLFNGDPTLGTVINNAINSNFDAFLKELQPLIEKALSNAFTDISNKIVNPFTYNQLFPAF